ncbi:hypothetical protein L7F22_069118 [Adiantum nelumboides]|nr:hypothetical protein [Adiantum nelumboides]
MSLYDAVVKVGFRAHEANMLPDFIIQAANEQHYELPAEFYQLVLGKHLKYSCALFNPKSNTLDEAEETMLALYCERACLKDGQTVLDLGFGWGSLSLYIAKNFPNCKITSVSNSTTQKKLIEDECRKSGFLNVNVIICDINSFEANAFFDRIFSIEMFEHMKNYEKLLYKFQPGCTQIAFSLSTSFVTRPLLTTLRKQGIYVEINSFRTRICNTSFEPQVSGEDDWLARYFFTGGTMPADGLILYFQDDVSILDHWRANGKHYSQTSEEWLKKMDINAKAVKSLFEKTYGTAAGKWWVYWRTFLLQLQNCLVTMMEKNGWFLIICS